MHFYTYDEWLNNAYYYLDDAELSIGRQKVYDISANSTDISDSTKLYIRSYWRNPTFVPTYSGGYADVAPPAVNIDCDLGCLYELNVYNDGSSLDPTNVDRYTETTRKNFLLNRGCIQDISNIKDPNATDTNVSGNYGCLDDEPYILLDKYSTHSSFDDHYARQITINIEKCRTKMNRILIFQSIYSGAISFQDMSSYLDFKFDNTQTYHGYDFRIHTNLYSSDSLMLAGALLTFDKADSNRGVRYYLTIENICKFVYGHVDMDNQYNWNMLWDTFKPASTSKLLDSSIMHRTKR